MSMRVGSVGMGLLVLTGCVRTVWYKQGVTRDEWNRETYECERDSRQSGYFGGGVAGAINMQEFFNRCMQAHGYERRRVDDDGELARQPKVRPKPPSGPDAEAIAEEQRSKNVLLRQTRAAAAATDGGTMAPPPEPAKFGRCSEDDMRGMLKAGLSSSAINAACFE